MELLLEITDGEETAEGYFVGRAIVGGEAVQDYRDQFGVMMYRPADEVFSEETLNSAKLMDVTLRHPKRDVGSDNWRDVSIGTTGEQVERVGNKMVINFKIKDAWVVKQIRKLRAAGKRIQFSLGYKAMPDKTPGTWMGRAYDWVQRRIRYNHLALLLDENGRYPETDILNDSQNDDGELLLLLDSYLAPNSNPQEGPKVKKKLPNGAEIEVTDADAHYLDNHLTDYAAKVDELATIKGEKLQLQRDLNTAQANMLDSEGIANAVNSRLELALEAATVLDSADVKELAAMSPREIREAVLIADGYTAEELKALQVECGDSYEATLNGMYRTMLRNAGAQNSSSIHDAAGSASVASVGRGGEIVVKDSTSEARKKQAERMEKQRKGENI